MYILNIHVTSIPAENTTISGTCMVLDSISSLQFTVHIMGNEFTELSQILIKLPHEEASHFHLQIDAVSKRLASACQ
jgi:hypothetical protein